MYDKVTIKLDGQDYNDYNKGLLPIVNSAYDWVDRFITNAFGDDSEYTKYLRTLFSFDENTKDATFAVVRPKNNPILFLGLRVVPDTLDLVIYNSAFDSEELILVGNLYRYFWYKGVRCSKDDFIEFMLLYKTGKISIVEFFDKVLTTKPDLAFSQSVVLGFLRNTMKDVTGFGDLEYDPDDFLNDFSSLMGFQSNITEYFLYDLFNWAENNYSRERHILRIIDKFKNNPDEFPELKQLGIPYYEDQIVKNRKVSDDIKLFSARVGIYSSKENVMPIDKAHSVLNSLQRDFKNRKEEGKDSSLYEYLLNKRVRRMKLMSLNSLLSSVTKELTQKDFTSIFKQYDLITASMIDLMASNKEFRNDFDLMMGSSSIFSTELYLEKDEREEVAKKVYSKLVEKYKGIISKNKIDSISNVLIEKDYSSLHKIRYLLPRESFGRRYSDSDYKGLLSVVTPLDDTGVIDYHSVFSDMSRLTDPNLPRQEVDGLVSSIITFLDKNTSMFKGKGKIIEKFLKTVYKLF